MEPPTPANPPAPPPGENVAQRYRRVFIEGSNTERLVFFSDAVFAIAMTLLVIDLHVPEVATGTSWDVLVEEWPSFIAYALSFTIIGINWAAHYRKFRVIRSHDGTLMVLDLALLFVVAFVPFPTSLLSTYSGEAPAVTLYAFTVGLLSVLQYVMWRHAWNKGLVDASVDEKLYRYVRTSQWSTPIVFWLSIPIALLWSAQVAMYFWFALFPVNIIMGRLSRNRG